MDIREVSILSIARGTIEASVTVVILLILTVLFWGTVPIIEKIGLTRTDPLVALTIRSIVVFLVFLSVSTITGKIKTVVNIDTRTFLIFALSGIFAGILGMWTYFGVLKRAPASKVVPIAASYPLITAILSVLILKEEVSFWRIMGIILIIIGIWLVR